MTEPRPDAATVLHRLAMLAERIMNAPRLDGDFQEAEAMQGMVADFAKVPVVDTPRFVGDEALLLAQALCITTRARRARNDRTALLGCQVIGVLIPRVREDGLWAIKARAEGVLAADRPQR